MTIEEAREQLKDLIRDRESFIVGDDDEIYRKDIEVLKKALELFEKQMPRKVIRSIYNVRFYPTCQGFCPTCQGSVWQNRDESKYCFRCGQALKWEDKKR